MNKCMVDLETLGNKPGCTIMSIGAVMFDEVEGKLGETFYVTINRGSCAAAGLVEAHDTLKWWGEQAPEAQTILREVELAGSTLGDALTAFSEWLVRIQYQQWIYHDDLATPQAKIMDKLTVWGNGADFDNAILAVAYSKVGLLPPWHFWNNRCYRTLKGLYKAVKLERVGVHHNALDDAKTQARHAIALLRVVDRIMPMPWWKRIYRAFLDGLLLRD